MADSDNKRLKTLGVVQDLKVVYLVLGTALLVGGVLIGAGEWFFDLQSATQATEEHRTIRTERMQGDDKVRVEFKAVLVEHEDRVLKVLEKNEKKMDQLYLWKYRERNPR